MTPNLSTLTIEQLRYVCAESGTKKEWAQRHFIDAFDELARRYEQAHLEGFNEAKEMAVKLVIRGPWLRGAIRALQPKGK